MIGSSKIKQKKKISKIEARPFPGQLPEGIILPKKLELANKLVNSVKNLENTISKYSK